MLLRSITYGVILGFAMHGLFNTTELHDARAWGFMLGFSLPVILLLFIYYYGESE